MSENLWNVATKQFREYFGIMVSHKTQTPFQQEIFMQYHQDQMLKIYIGW